MRGNDSATGPAMIVMGHEPYGGITWATTIPVFIAQMVNLAEDAFEVNNTFHYYIIAITLNFSK